MSVSTDEKPLTHSERGIRGAASRWSKPENRTTVKIGDLTPAERGVVLALIAAQRAAKAGSA